MNQSFDLTICDREPIHIPGAVQQHGALIVVDPDTLRVTRAGGAADRFFGRAAADLLGRPLSGIAPEASRLALSECDAEPRYVGTVSSPDGGALDVVAHAVAGHLVLEFESAPARRVSAPEMAQLVERVASAFAAAPTMADLCREAAACFRSVTGFDRLMVYRFLPDESGSVVAEDKAAELPPFLNHRYPASDIPRQARELYVRNIVRVIPDVHYTPAPLVAARDEPPLDMSHCHLRSVSPVHIQYLKNMEVGASASFSIVREGKLWGLIACHHRTPKSLSFDQRTTCRLLAGALARQIAGLEDAELFKARMRTRAAEDVLFAQLAREPAVEQALADHVADLMSIVPAHGVAVRHADTVAKAGRTPRTEEILAIGNWLLTCADGHLFESSCLSQDHPPFAPLAGVASGLLALTISTDEPHQVLWFRAEQVEEINWAGNPHKPVEPGAPLTPRRSFELWKETVTARAQPWSPVEGEAAVRLGRVLADLQQARSINRLNDSLKEALAQRDRLISQKDLLLREGDHRIQNSLQIVGSMLSLQLRETTDPAVRAQLEEAMSRVQAVGLVHRRLYKSAHPQSVDVDVYVGELVAELAKSLGESWAAQMRLHTAPVKAATDLAMSLGLAATELVLNAAKYAYDGKTGPLEINLQERGGQLQLTVRDWGRGPSDVVAPGGGLGSRLILRLVESLQGTIVREHAAPGLRAVITVPLRKPVPAQ